MLAHLRTAHMHKDPENVSTGGWIVQRLVVLSALVVFVAPFVIDYVAH
jgi:hypothetical protein